MICSAKKPEKLRLNVQPYITAMEMDWPLDDYTIALKQSQNALRGEASNAVDAPPSANTVTKVRPPKKEKVFVAVHRHDDDLYYKRLDPIAYKMLGGLRRENPRHRR